MELHNQTKAPPKFVAVIVRSVLRIRQSNVLRSEDIQLFSEILDRIDADLWSFSGTPLLKSLCHFIQPLDFRIREALVHAAQNLQSRPHGAELARLLQNSVFENFSEDDPCFVLCEPGLLSEVFRNIFTNVRHAYREDAPLPPVRITRVSSDGNGESGTDAESGSRFTTVIEITTPGDAALITLDRDQSPSTLTRHKAELQDYAADLRVRSSDQSDGVVFRLSFR